MTDPSTAVVPHEGPSFAAMPASVAIFEAHQRMAKLFALSGCFADVKGSSVEQQIAKAYVKIALGEAMGFSPAESMSGIDLIQGKPAIGAHLRAARMAAAGYRWSIDRLDAEGCELTVHRGDRKLGRVVFVKADAQRMSLLGKDNWKKNAEDMYFARAITRAQRRFAPEALQAYVMDPDEARMAAEEDGAPIPAEIVEPPKRGAAALAASLDAEEEQDPSAEPEPPADAEPESADGPFAEEAPDPLDLDEARLRKAYDMGVSKANDPDARCSYKSPYAKAAWVAGRLGDDFDIERIAKDVEEGNAGEEP